MAISTLFSSVRFGNKPRNRDRLRCRLETLEPRELLAGDSLLISELLSINDSTLADVDGEFTDWIEIHNPTARSINLDGWHLTDDPNNLAKWTFPNKTVAAGDFLVVFASGKDRSSSRDQLHTNFKLSGSGEYLALVRPEQTIIHSFDPEFPRQDTDISYGVTFGGFDLLGENIFADTFVPSDDSLGLDWAMPDFVIDESLWSSRQTPIGFGITIPDLSIPGFTVRDVRSTGSIVNLEDADALLSGEGIAAEATQIGTEMINFSGSGDDGFFADDSPYPNGDGNNFAIHSKATLVVSDAGDYTFGVNSTDGVRLSINGEELISKSTRGGQFDYYSTRNLSAGNHTLEYIMFQSSRSTTTELYIAPGEHTAFNDAFKLLGDPTAIGVEVFADTGGGEITDIESEMRGIGSSAYLRFPLVVTEADAVESLSLQVQYNDAFIAYLNGQEIARRNAPVDANWDSTAETSRDEFQTLTFDEIDVTSHLGLLQEGSNLLAVHALNTDVDDETFLISPKLIGDGLLTSQQRYFAVPTPGEVNSSDLFGFVEDTKFSSDRGFYDEPFQLEISTATQGASIRYTLDGSDPRDVKKGLTYSGPIVIDTTTTIRAAAFKPGYRTTDVETQTYIFVQDVLRQDIANLPNEYPQTWQANFTGDYNIDPEIATEVNNPLYQSTLAEDLKAIPTMSIVMDHHDLWDSAEGIYPNSNTRGEAWRRPTSVEFFDPNTGEEFQIDAGIQIHGGASRDNVRLGKHSFRLLFRNDFGPGSLNYPLMPGSDVESFNTLVLRAFFTDSFATRTASGRYSALDSQYLRDVWMKDTLAEMGQLSTNNTYAHLYINGLYWGLYNIAERPDDAFLAEHLGGNREDYDIIKDFNELFAGEKTVWNEMFAIANADLASNEAYQRIQGNNPNGTPNPEMTNYLDVENLIDYMILHLYGGAEDWPHHNWYGARDRVGESKGFQFFVWDQEIAIDGYYRDRIDVGPPANHNFTPARLYSQLRANEEFRLRFADRVYHHLFHGGALTSEVAQDIWMARADEIEQAIIGESARWGDAREGIVGDRGVIVPTMTVDLWRAERDNVRDNYFPTSHEIVLDRFRRGDLFPTIDPPEFYIEGFPHHGGQFNTDQLLTIRGSRQRGEDIFYTLDGTDPRLLGGDLSPSAIEYSDPIALTDNAVIKTRARNGRVWSAISEARFSLGEPVSANNLAITEILYNPSGPSADELNINPEFNNDDFEFLEFKNIGDQPIDLIGVQLTNGVTFEFTDISRSILAPGEHFVIAGDATAFEARYGNDVHLAGQYQGNLNNDGERIEVLDANGETIHSFRYNDNADWPAEADGEGNSLEVLDVAGNYDDPLNWRAGSEPLGSPGFDGSGPVDGPKIESILLSSSDWSPTFLEHLDAEGMGKGGFDILTAGEPTVPLPWANINQIMIAFSEDLAVSPEDLLLHGVQVTDYIAELGLADPGFSYDAATHTAVWTLAEPPTTDHLLIGIHDSIVSLNNVFPISILPGDANGNGRVTNRDVQLLRSAMLSSVGDIGYSEVIDFDGSGWIDINDLQPLRENLLAELPEGMPAVNLFAQEYAEVSTESPINRVNLDEQTNANYNIETREVILRAVSRRDAAELFARVNDDSAEIFNTETKIDPLEEKNRLSASWHDEADLALDELTNWIE